MSASVVTAALGTTTADAAAGSIAPTLPMRKRKKSDDDNSSSPTQTPDCMPPQTKIAKTMDSAPQTMSLDDKKTKRAPAPAAPMSKAREVRLEQNRKAARESRRRKKVMIEELQRSVIFFSRANSTLKQQNDELARLLMSAQSQAAAIESGKQQGIQVAKAPEPAPAPAPTPVPPPPPQQAAAAATVVQPESKLAEEGKKDEPSFQQAQADAVAAQALYESQGYPAAAARVAAQTLTAGMTTEASAPAPQTEANRSLPPMQPGATMQAMANFQQAAAAAMQAAMQGMQGIPGMNINALAAPQVCANPQQAYTDTMTAIAMQQAAAAAAGQQLAAAGQQFAVFQPGSFLTHPMLAWQQSQAAVAAAASASAAAGASAHQVQTSNGNV